MSNQIQINTPAPDFTLLDINGKTISLKDYNGNKPIILVFNRGFM